MRVALIHPPNTSVYSKFQRGSIKRMPIGLAYIAAFCERLGHDVYVIDAEADEISIESTVESVLAYAPRVVGITATTPIIHVALSILQAIKLRNPELITILGGPHASSLPEETLSLNHSFLDFIVFGEGEYSISEILKIADHQHPLPPSGIPGVAYIDSDGNIIKGPPRFREKNLDVFPFPARHLFPVDKYVDHTKFGSEKYTLFVTSRGCPSQCIFCGSQATWGQITHFRSPQNVIEEIVHCIDRFDITNFVFCDDTFTLRKNHTIEICKKMIDLQKPLRLFCSSRVDTISPDRLEWLRKAGCYCITFGLESGNDAILRLMKKGTSVRKIQDAVDMTKAAGIAVHGSFIIGNVGDTEETINETIQFALDLDLDDVQFSILVPLPGTECYQMAIDENAFRCLPGEFEKFYWYYSVAANFTRLPDEALLEFQRNAYDRWRKTKQNLHNSALKT